MLSVSETVLDAQDTSKGTFLFNQGVCDLVRRRATQMLYKAGPYCMCCARVSSGCT